MCTELRKFFKTLVRAYKHVSLYQKLELQFEYLMPMIAILWSELFILYNDAILFPILPLNINIILVKTLFVIVYHV